jgi:hypothetical protein
MSATRVTHVAGKTTLDAPVRVGLAEGLDEMVVRLRRYLRACALLQYFRR